MVLHDSDTVGQAGHRGKTDLLHEGLLINRGKGLELVISVVSSVALPWPCSTFTMEPFVFFDCAPPREDAPNFFSFFDLTDVKVVSCGTAAPVRAGFWVLDQATVPDRGYDIKGASPGKAIVDVKKVVSCDDEEALLRLERGWRTWKTRGTNTMKLSLLRVFATLCIQMIFERQRCARRRVLP